MQEFGCDMDTIKHVLKFPIPFCNKKFIAYQIFAYFLKNHVRFHVGQPNNRWNSNCTRSSFGTFRLKTTRFIHPTKKISKDSFIRKDTFLDRVSEIPGITNFNCRSRSKSNRWQYVKEQLIHSVFLTTT